MNTDKMMMINCSIKQYFLVLSIVYLILFSATGSQANEDTVNFINDRSNAEYDNLIRENAIRLIIQDAMQITGSNINDSVSLNGSFEFIAGRTEDFSQVVEQELSLNTAELEFTIKVNDWTSGNLTVEWDAGTSTTAAGEESKFERLYIDTAYFTIGDASRFAPTLTIGRMNLSFGVPIDSSAGNLLSISDPIGVKVFSFRNNAIKLDIGFPKSKPVPQFPPIEAPTVRSLVFSPLLESLVNTFAYKPTAKKLKNNPTIFPRSVPTKYNISLYTYNGSSFDPSDDLKFRMSEHYGASVGYRSQGSCGLKLYELLNSSRCPWTVSLEFAYISSIFDSEFFESEYSSYFDQIGLVGGLSLSQKATFGPYLFIGQQTWAVKSARFVNSIGNITAIRPSTYQFSMVYQFDWNPLIEEIGAQGTYLTVDYSRSSNLAGIIGVIDGETSRLGNVPQQQFTLGMGEWLTDNVKLTLEYSYSKDYTIYRGGTGNSSSSALIALSLDW